MADLRWILLAAGLVFLLVLAVWELQRGRRARRAAAAEAEHAAREAVLGQASHGADLPRAWRSRGTSADGAEPGRNPLVEDDPDDPTHDHADDGAEVEPDSPALAQAEPAASRDSAVPRRLEPTLLEADLVSAGTPLAAAAPLEASPPLRVEWPDERERRILAVRIVAPPSDRLAGRLVRQALGACGFIHGPYRIYHQPAADGRSVLSCANLTQPGDFDPLTLDFQRLTGLSVFAVLPGPLPPLAAFDHLLETAADLAQRLRAELADERGAELDDARVAALRAAAEQWSPPGVQAIAGAPGAAGAERTRGA